MTTERREVIEIGKKYLIRTRDDWPDGQEWSGSTGRVVGISPPSKNLDDPHVCVRVEGWIDPEGKNQQLTIMMYPEELVCLSESSSGREEINVRHFARVLSFMFVIASLVWSIAVVLHGKILMNEIFMCAINDVWIMLALNISAAVGVLILLLTRYRQPS